ncbi:MAG: UDP-N-acetylmuramate--L-alanine ligase [Deltaproteobacteria bacterium]|nr:UDP-N-acetylmuramate--L-alanine ligase [Deltaproteobacteria bacterium]
MGRVKHIHFVGIGGVGMGGIAEVLLNQGYAVSGSDIAANAMTQRLQGLGVKIAIGHNPQHVQGADVVVVSSAVATSNPEVEAARQLRLPIVPRAQMLAELMRFHRGIAIAGTHGKTTTTSLIASVLAEAGLDPTFVIGGRLNQAGTHARLGASQYFVAEADESDASFLLLLPTIAVVTNIDPEHLDYYGTMQRVREAYLNFINRVPFYGIAVLGIDSINVRGLLPAIRKPIVTYGVSPDADLRAEEIVIGGLSTRFEVIHKGELVGRVTIPLPGHHLALNALAAISVAFQLGIDFGIAARALAAFSGISRRFEIKGAAAGRIILDDYAHHPEEVRATLRAARAAFQRRIVTVFQPHRYTRLRDLFDDFLGAFDDTDVLYLMEVYAAGEDPMPDVSARRLYEGMRARGHLNVHYLAGESEPVLRLIRETADGDLLITLGAGDVYKLGEDLLALLAQARFTAFIDKEGTERRRV